MSTHVAIPAMAFYNEDGFEAAYRGAVAFAGTGGRLATLPDVLEARLVSDSHAVAWSHYVTTMSSEFYGWSSAGVPLIVVAHGVGPMTDVETVTAVYAAGAGDENRPRGSGRIDGDTFRQLLYGHYGDVHVIDFRHHLASAGEYAFGPRTAEQVLANDLWVARLGGRDLAERYVARHESLALEDFDRQHMRGPREAGMILRMEQTSDFGYVSYENRPGQPLKEVARQLDGDFAIAHLLSIAGLVNSMDGHRSHLQSDISPHSESDGVRLVGLRAGAVPAPFHAGFDMERALRDWRDRLWVEETQPIEAARLSVLERFSKEWFVQYPKEGNALDTGEPAYRVETVEKVGGPAVLEVVTAGFYGFLRYDIASVEKLQPEGANAYALASDVMVGAGGNSQAVLVQFYKITADRSRRLLRRSEILSDPALLLRVIEA